MEKILIEKLQYKRNFREGVASSHLCAICLLDKPTTAP